MQGRPSPWVAWPARDPERGQHNAKALEPASVAGNGGRVRRTAGRARRHECRCSESAREEQRRTCAAAVRRGHEPEDSLERGDLGEGAEPLAPPRRLRAGAAAGGADRSAGACGASRCRPEPLGPRASSVRSRFEPTRSASSTSRRTTASSTPAASSAGARPTSAPFPLAPRGVTTASNLRLVTQELEPLLNPQNQVNGFVAVGANDTGESSNFTVHVLCFTG